MRKLILVAGALVLTSSGHTAPTQTKMICVVENSAGILIPGGNQPSQASSINLPESHKKFVLTISPIIRTKFDYSWCLQSLKHWEGYLAAQESYPVEGIGRGTAGKDVSKMYDMRQNMGPMCFSNSQARLKFFDSREESKLLSYDFLPNEFQGLPGEWLKLYGMKFEVAQALDAGPIVMSGSCEAIPD